jgi:TolB protein
MRLPIIPFVIAATLLAGVWYLFNASHSNARRIPDVPHVNRLGDVEGVETEVSVSPDGSTLAVIASGDLWIFNPTSGERKQLTHTPETEWFPAWMPDGKRISFSRGTDTFTIDPITGAEQLFRSNATWLSWSHTSRTTFVRDRALWIANPNDQNEMKLVDADMVPDIEIQAPRFSPDALQIAFIKSQLGIRGEVWIVDALKAMPRALVADRPAENPFDSAWINNGTALVYLTNRAGTYSLWYYAFVDSTVRPLTQSMITVPLSRIGIAAYQDRIFLPRHIVDSNIVLSDGATVAGSDKVEFQPAASPDGTRVVYTVAQENKFEIWTAGIKGEMPTFRTLGREPRFSANGFQIVYTYTDLSGNDDIWKLDIRNGSAERVTDAEEIDLSPDWSPDGRSIAFASARGGALAIWTIPASGGKRLRINSAGYAPRFSPDSKSILFWNKQSMWTMDTDGSNLREVSKGVLQPTAGVWSKTKEGSGFLVKPPGVDRLTWPGFDILKDGRFVFAPIDIRDTALWAIDLTYKEK